MVDSDDASRTVDLSPMEAPSNSAAAQLSDLISAASCNINSPPSVNANADTRASPKASSSEAASVSPKSPPSAVALKVISLHARQSQADRDVSPIKARVIARRDSCSSSIVWLDDAGVDGSTRASIEEAVRRNSGQTRGTLEHVLSTAVDLAKERPRFLVYLMIGLVVLTLALTSTVLLLWSDSLQRFPSPPPPAPLLTSLWQGLHATELAPPPPPPSPPPPPPPPPPPFPPDPPPLSKVDVSQHVLLLMAAAFVVSLFSITIAVVYSLCFVQRPEGAPGTMSPFKSIDDDRRFSRLPSNPSASKGDDGPAAKESAAEILARLADTENELRMLDEKVGELRFSKSPERLSRLDDQQPGAGREASRELLARVAETEQEVRTLHARVGSHASNALHLTISHSLDPLSPMVMVRTPCTVPTPMPMGSIGSQNWTDYYSLEGRQLSSERPGDGLMEGNHGRKYVSPGQIDTRAAYSAPISTTAQQPARAERSPAAGCETFGAVSPEHISETANIPSEEFEAVANPASALGSMPRSLGSRYVASAEDQDHLPRMPARQIERPRSAAVPPGSSSSIDRWCCPGTGRAPPSRLGNWRSMAHSHERMNSIHQFQYRPAPDSWMDEAYGYDTPRRGSMSRPEVTPACDTTRT